MLWLLSLAMRLALAALSLLKTLVLAFRSRSASDNSPYLIAVLALLMFNSLFLSLGLVLVDPNAKPSADGILVRMFTCPPIKLDYRLMWQLTCLSWKLRGSLLTICRLYLRGLGVIVSFRHLLWSAYPAYCTMRPVLFALYRFLLAYLRVVLATYRVASAAYKLNAAASRYAALLVLFVAVRVLSAELVQLALLFGRLILVSAKLAKQSYKSIFSCAVSLLVVAWPHVRSASRYALCAGYSSLCALALVQLAGMRSRAKILCFLPLALVPMLFAPRPPSAKSSVIPLKSIGTSKGKMKT